MLKIDVISLNLLSAFLIKKCDVKVVFKVVEIGPLWTSGIAKLCTLMISSPEGEQWKILTWKKANFSSDLITLFSFKINSWWKTDWISKLGKSVFIYSLFGYCKKLELLTSIEHFQA